MTLNPTLAPSTAPSLLIHAPYPEKAAFAIAEVAEGQRQSKLVSPSRAPSALGATAISRLKQQGRADRLTRGHKSLMSQETVGPTLDAVRLATIASGNHNVQRHWMYLSAKLFDSIAASKIEAHPHIFIGMPGASLAAFNFLAESSAICVFHAVNAHPKTHNEILKDHFGKQAAGEAIPQWMIERQIAELQLADIVLTPSSMVSTQMINQGLASNKIMQIPYGTWVTIDRDLPRPPIHSKTRILYVGQISYRKGIPFLIDAGHQSSAYITMIGPVVSRALLENLPSNMRYIGACSASEVREEMKVSDALVLPTVEDACALVTLEAASMGLPVITTSANGAHTLLGEEEKIIVEPGEPNALARAINDIGVLTLKERQDRITRVQSSRTVRAWHAYGETVLQELDSSLLK